MMPFANPIGGYYSSVYDPAIRKAGLTPIRADNEMFGAGLHIRRRRDGPID